MEKTAQFFVQYFAKLKCLFKPFFSPCCSYMMSSYILEESFRGLDIYSKPWLFSYP